jgi:two-component system nitrate/nitrite sensor histidine kinase NarX
VKEFNQSLATLRSGDPERPLFVPWDDTVHARFDIVEQDCAHFRARWINSNPSVLHDLL